RARPPRFAAGVFGAPQRASRRPPPAALASGAGGVPDAATLRRMRVLVTGGAGFIGSHFAKRLLAAGEEVVVLDKLTYSGNSANLEGADCEMIGGDVADAEAVDRAGAGCDAVVNFAAESHVDRSILGAAEFI